MEKEFLNRRFGPYILLKRIAVGGMAEIFLALRLGPGPVNKLVVLKCILSHNNEEREYVRMFYREAHLSCALQHPNLVNVWEVGQIARRHTMVMEYLRGVTLDVMIERAAERGIALPVEVAVWLCINALDGLQYLHNLRDLSDKALNVVHRDVSPQNIFACFDGQTKLFDFGVALFGQVQTASNLGMLVGKYAYMSPEQCNGAPLDKRSDIFSLAVVLYELTTGRSLFQKDNDIKTLDAVRRSDVVAPSTFSKDYPPFLELVLMKALQAKADDRYQSDEQFSEDLRKFLKISGYKQTNEALCEFLGKVFADEIAGEREYIKRGVLEAERNFPREDPLKSLRFKSGFVKIADDDVLEPEGVGVEAIETLFTPLNETADISMSRIAMLEPAKQHSLPSIKRRGDESWQPPPTDEDLGKDRAANTEVESQNTETTMRRQSEELLSTRKHRILYTLVGLILGIALSIGALALLSDFLKL